MSESDIQRFWRWVDKTGDCWLWTGRPATSEGYCRFGWKGAKQLAADLTPFRAQAKQQLAQRGQSDE